MESLISEIVPGIYDWLSSYCVFVFGFLASGLLLAFLMWTIAIVIDTAFAWVRNQSGM